MRSYTRKAAYKSALFADGFGRILVVDGQETNVEKEESKVSPLWYALGGAVIGVLVGVLYAPKKGSELRQDLEDLRVKGREKKRALMRALSGMIPLRVKAAAAMGALRAGGVEAIEIVKEDLHMDGNNK